MSAHVGLFHERAIQCLHYINIQHPAYDGMSTFQVRQRDPLMAKKT